MLMEAGYITEKDINIMIDEFVNCPRHRLETITDENGINLWPVTTDDDIVDNIDDYILKEGEEYILPTGE